MKINYRASSLAAVKAGFTRYAALLRKIMKSLYGKALGMTAQHQTTYRQITYMVREGSGWDGSGSPREKTSLLLKGLALGKLWADALPRTATTCLVRGWESRKAYRPLRVWS